MEDQAPEAVESAEPQVDDGAAEAVINASPKLSAALRLLNDRESSIRQRHEQFKQKERLVNEYQELQQLAQTDKVEALKRIGVSLDELDSLRTQSSDPYADLRNDMQAKYDQLSEALSRVERREQDMARANVHAEIKSAVNSHVDSSNEYPLVSAAGEEARDLVFQYILNAHQTEGRAVSEAEAASEVEARLTKLAEQLVPAYQAKNKLSANKPTNTLTNSLAGQTVNETSYSGLNPEEQFQLLLSRFNSKQG